MSLFILYGEIGLGPDEAQYWTWSQDLDWGYYSKPPGIAWIIRIGSFFFGNTEFGVRFPALILGFILPLLIYFFAKACRLPEEVCLWAGLTMAASPMGIFASLFSITDGGMIVFWTWACIYIAKGLEDESKKTNFLAIGFFIFCGSLFKWPIYFLWIFVILFSPGPKGRLLTGIGISLLGLFPSILWNYDHDWVTFRHVGATLVGGNRVNSSPASGNPMEFVGSQAALLSPIPFVLLILSFFAFLKNLKRLSPSLLFCGTLSLSVLLIYFLFSIRMKMQGNWCLFAYPTAIVLLCWYTFEVIPEIGKKILSFGLVFSVVLSCLVLFIPYIQSHSVFNYFPISYHINPFKHNLGWTNLAIALKKSGYNPERDFLFGDKYQMSSLLSFYGEGQKRAYFLNIQGTRKNQFSFWPSMAQEQKGNEGYFVVAENVHRLGLNQTQEVERYIQLLQPYFSKIDFKGSQPLFSSYGKVVKVALIFKCTNYNGNSPKESYLF